mgnify:FL=1
MAAAIGLRDDLSGDDLRRLARDSRDAKQVRRLPALAVIAEGGTRTEAARIGGVGLQIIRDRVLRFNAEGPAGLIDRKAPGKAPTLTAVQRAALARVVEAGPEPWRDGVVRWRRIDLAQWLWEAFRVSVSEATVGRELRALGLPQALGAAAAPRPGPGGGGGFQKSLPERVAEVRATHPGKRIELWFQDEARIGQKNKLARRWARRGTRPRAPHDQRTACRMRTAWGSSPSGLRVPSAVLPGCSSRLCGCVPTASFSARCGVIRRWHSSKRSTPAIQARSAPFTPTVQFSRWSGWR